MNPKKPRHGCLFCRQPVKRNANTYCSVHCQQEEEYTRYICRWLEGRERGYGAEQQLSRYIHRWLREERGDRCEKCGWHEIHPITGKIPIEGNHRDGDAKNCRPENLELICPNCHSLTSNFRGLNKGNGRANRRNRWSSSVGRAPHL